jgi:uncharacterized membrane protein
MIEPEPIIEVRTPSPLSLRSRILTWDRKTVLAYAALALCVVVLSLSGLFVRWAGAPGTVTSFYRMGIAAVVMTAIIVQRREQVRPARWSLMLLPLVGGLFTALDHSTWSTAIGYTNIATATLLNNIAPLWVALIAVLFWRERLKGTFWIGLALALSGAGIVFGSDLIHESSPGPRRSAGNYLLAVLCRILPGYATRALALQRYPLCVADYAGGGGVSAGPQPGGGQPTARAVAADLPDVPGGGAHLADHRLLFVELRAGPFASFGCGSDDDHPTRADCFAGDPAGGRTALHLAVGRRWGRTGRHLHCKSCAGEMIGI